MERLAPGLPLVAARPGREMHVGAGGLQGLGGRTGVLDARIAEDERKASGELLKRQVEEFDREHPERTRTNPKKEAIIKLVALCIVIVLVVVGIAIGASLAK